MQGKKIRLGFVGYGRIFKKHFEAIIQHKKDIELVAICEASPEKLEIAKSETKANVYTTIEKMLVSEKLDLVTIATPNGLHAKHIKQIADASVNVVTEKPMALSLLDATEVAKYCEERKVKLFVVHQNRFNNTCQEVYKALKADRFGKIYMITSNVFWSRNQDYYDTDGRWHGSKDLDGGAFYTQAYHYIDFMQWIADASPRKVYANLKTLARNIETEDSGVAAIEWNNDILSSINVTMLTYPRNLEGSITVIGEKGTVKIGGVAMNKIEHWEFSDHKPSDDRIMDVNYETDCVYGFGHAPYYEDVIKSLKHNTISLVSADEGIKSVKIIDAIHKSNQSGNVVEF